jgi:DNA primase
MQRLSDATVTAVKSVQDIVGIIQDYVKLRRRGRNYIGLCPFHSERTPSFTVSPDKHLWHCFGCKESGDHIGFVMKIDHLSFTEAIEHIALKLGIGIEWEERSPEAALIDQEMNRLRAQLSAVKSYYQHHFTNPATQYMDSRGIAAEISHQFSVGYSPDGTGLITHLHAHGFTDAEIQTAGIAIQSNGKLHDRFAGRLIFPILDDRGRTIGFGGRVLTDHFNGPKYINSDETRTFAKRRVLYGLDHAKPSIRKLDAAIIMEGYLDVITAHQYGFTNSVAALGTSFSADHARILSRLSSVVITALDQDEAGRLATDRVYDHCTALGMTVRVALFKEKDPADALIQQGRDYFEDCITQSISFTEFKFKQLVVEFPPNRIENVSKIIDTMIPYLRKESDLVVQRYYARRIATFLKVEPELILAKISSIGYTRGPKRFYSSPTNKKTKYQQAEEYLLFSMATSISDRARILESIESSDFQTPEYQSIASLISHYSVTDRELIDALPSDDFRQLLSRIMIERAGDAPGSIDECIRMLQRHPIEQRIHEIKQLLKSLPPDQEDRTESLLSELQTLINGLEEG